MKCSVKVPHSPILGVSHIDLLFTEASAYYHPMRVTSENKSLTALSFQSLPTLKDIIINSRINILEYTENDIGEATRTTRQGREPYNDGQVHREIHINGIASIEATPFIGKNLSVLFHSAEHTINGVCFGGKIPLILRPQIQGVEIICDPNGITGIGKVNNAYLMVC